MPNLQVETEQTDDGTRFVIPSQYRGNLGKYLSSAAPSYADALRQVQNSPNFANATLKDGQRRSYTFGTLSFTFNSKKTDYLPILENMYGKDAVNQILSGAANAGATTDEEILDLLYNELAIK